MNWTSRPGGQLGHGPWAHPARILVVDDDPALLEALPTTIQHRLPGSIVDTADTADHAVLMCQREEYDAVISDLCMPISDGRLLLKRVQAIRPLTPILLISGSGDESYRSEANTLGAYAFLNKPLDPDFLTELLKQAIIQHRLHLLRPTCAA